MYALHIYYKGSDSKPQMCLMIKCIKNNQEGTIISHNTCVQVRVSSSLGTVWCQWFLATEFCYHFKWSAERQGRVTTFHVHVWKVPNWQWLMHNWSIAQTTNFCLIWCYAVYVIFSALNGYVLSRALGKCKVCIILWPCDSLNVQVCFSVVLCFSTVLFHLCTLWYASAACNITSDTRIILSANANIALQLWITNSNIAL